MLNDFWPPPSNDVGINDSSEVYSEKKTIVITLTSVVIHPSTMERSMLGGAPIVVVEVATCCCMYASRFSIKTLSQLALITESLIECIILRIRNWI